MLSIPRFLLFQILFYQIQTVKMLTSREVLINLAALLICLWFAVCGDTAFIYKTNETYS